MGVSHAPVACGLSDCESARARSAFLKDWVKTALARSVVTATTWSLASFRKPEGDSLGSLRLHKVGGSSLLMVSGGWTIGITDPIAGYISAHLSD